MVPQVDEEPLCGNAAWIMPLLLLLLLLNIIIIIIIIIIIDEGRGG